MPKSNFCKPKQDERPARVQEMLMGGMARRGMMMKDLAIRTGINKSTLSKRKNHPETITLGELWAIVDVLEPDEGFEKKIILKGADKHD